MPEKRSRILVVDDDKDILDLLKYNLEREGFKVKTVDDSSKTIKVAKKFCPDLIILDVMMPEVNGIELCESLRNIPMFENTYIFFLTAKSAHQQKAFRRGGDDYIEKLMGLRSLIHKINFVLKERLVIQKRISQIDVGNLHINRDAHAVVLGDKEILLNAAEFELLFLFAQNRHKILSRDTIVRTLSGIETQIVEGSLDGYINNLRAKIVPNIIKIVSHKGFQFGL